jgi:hypothetical protein
MSMIGGHVGVCMTAERKGCALFVLQYLDLFVWGAQERNFTAETRGWLAITKDGVFKGLQTRYKPGERPLLQHERARYERVGVVHTSHQGWSAVSQ